MKRKFLISGMIAIFFISASVYAQELTVDVTRNVENNTVTVESKSVAEDWISIQIMPQNITPEQIEANTQIGENTVFCATKQADAEGKYVFSTKLDMGNYMLYVASSETDGVISQALRITDAEAYSALIEQLKALELNEFVLKVEENKEILGFDIELYSKGSVERYYKEYKNNMSTTDYDFNVANFTKSALIESLNDKKDVDVVAYVKKVFADDTELIDFITRHIVSDSANKLFSSYMTGHNIENSDDLLVTAEKAIILTAVKYPNGNMNIKEIMQAYNDEILGLSSISSKAGVYNELAGNSYNNIPALLQAYNDAVKNQEISSSSESSGGGGTNSKKYVNTGAYTSFATTVAGSSVNDKLSIKFEDLDSVTWAYRDIAELYEKGIISGFSEIEFKPNDSVKREQLIKMIISASGLEEETAEYCGYSDVALGDWYEKYVSIAKKLNIVSGIGDNLFGVGADITRQDMAVMIYNAMCKNGYTTSGAENNFADKDLCAAYANEAISELSSIGIINGVGDNNFDPKSTATRAQAAVIINRALKYLI